MDHRRIIRGAVRKFIDQRIQSSVTQTSLHIKKTQLISVPYTYYIFLLNLSVWILTTFSVDNHQSIIEIKFLWLGQ